jgi:hypothetical protein
MHSQWLAVTVNILGLISVLQLPIFAASLSRVMRVGATARFVEPAQGNIFLRAFRALSPKLRTVDEYPFDDNSIAALAKAFNVKIIYHGLARPALPMLAGNAAFMTRFSKWLDRKLLTIALLQKQARLLQIELIELSS